MATTPKSCDHVDVDSHGLCYDCGAYVSQGDVGPAIAAAFPGLYESVTGRPAWLDADETHPTTQALSALADETDEDES